MVGRSSLKSDQFSTLSNSNNGKKSYIHVTYQRWFLEIVLQCDALVGWKMEALPLVEVPAAAKWKFGSKPFQQVILDYDYTFTTPYCGSQSIEINTENVSCFHVILASDTWPL